MLQREPQKATEIVERFGCFISYLIRSYSIEKTGHQDFNESPKDALIKFENQCLKIIKKPIDQLLTRNRGELSILTLIYPVQKGNRLIDQNLIEVMDLKLRLSRMPIQTLKI